ncbi:MAG: O-antigen ligase family protein, partial [Elusimicrobiota bacterium]
MNAARRWPLVVCHFVCPLLFFTNLTRNPYITQIALLHAGVSLALAAWAWSESSRPDGWRLPRLPVAAPLALFLVFWGLSWLRAYFGHAEFYRSAIIAEGARAAVFLAVICVGAFVVAASIATQDDGSSDVALGSWIAFTLVWGLLWTAFPQARTRLAARPEDFWALAWDPYGALLWGLGLGGAFWLTKRGRVTDFLHLAFCAGFLASAYGVLQYFNVEVVWPNVLNPYGGRAVSTFGNPNFLSSYNVVLMPIVLALFIEERQAWRRVSYAALFLTLEAALLATLTRSSWMGALAGSAALMFSPRLRAQVRERPRQSGLLLAGIVALVALWPSSGISTGYTPTVLVRLTEAATTLHHDGAYSPFHQRVLIWTCAWLMGSQAPLLGKGGGLFELFYPFYQGHLLHEIPFFRTMRTHANNSHNEILEVFSQTGLLGLGAFIAVWVVFFWAVWKWSKVRPGREGLWIGAAAGCAGMLTDNMLNVSLHFAVPAFMFWWAAGTVMGRGEREAAERRVWKAPITLRRFALAGLVAAVLGVVWLQVRFWNREAFYFAGFKQVRQGNLPAATLDLERSRFWGPREVNALYELGNVYARSARPADAARAYREALDANA